MKKFDKFFVYALGLSTTRPNLTSRPHSMPSGPKIAWIEWWLGQLRITNAKNQSLWFELWFGRLRKWQTHLLDNWFSSYHKLRISTENPISLNYFSTNIRGSQPNLDKSSQISPNLSHYHKLDFNWHSLDPRWNPTGRFDAPSRLIMGFDFPHPKWLGQV